MRRAHERLRRIGWVREAVRETNSRRRRVCERLGSDRSSRPSPDSIDEQLAGHLPERGGVFVEAGAYDGFTQSNTYWLERFRGWSGVLVEAIPELAEQAKRNRPRSRVVQCALVSDDFTGETV